MTRSAMATTVRSWLKALRTRGRMLACAFSRRVECVACDWQGRRFLDDAWHRDVCCPKCGSSVRHRLLLAAHRHLPGLSFAATYGGRRVLHVAPEPIVGKHICPVAAAYVRADYLHDGVDIRLDITDMQEVADGAYDVIIACDVLEHVGDFRRALAEMHRVLAAGGLAVLTVPQEDGLAVTREDPSLTTDEQRRLAFGQHDHVRMFGDDFASELDRHGFDVSIIDASSFSPDLVVRYRLGPERSPHPLATNHRRVFICRRRSRPTQ
ncbi:MAG: class I SAM-dependent methyltransferase [Planctomycetaceae bacterium]